MDSNTGVSRRPSSSSSPPSFRIKVDLTDFGAQRLVWYLVNSQTLNKSAARQHRRICDTIGQLQRDIRRRFLNESRSDKMGATEVWLDDAAVPDDESVQLLSSNDTIVIRLKHTQYELSGHNEDDDQDSSATSTADEETEKSSKKAKKRRRINGDPHNAAIAADVEPDKDVYYAVEPVRKKTKKSKRNKERIAEDVLEEAIPEEDEEADDEEEEATAEPARSNKKRKKSKKRKHQIDPDEDEQMELNVSKRTTIVAEQQVLEAEVEAQRTRKDKRKDRTSLRRKRKRVLERSLKRAEKMNHDRVSIEPVESSVISENGDGDVQADVHPSAATMHIRFTEQDDSTVTGQRRCNNTDQAEQKQQTEREMEPQSEFSFNEQSARINSKTNSNRHLKKMAQRDVLTNNSVTISQNAMEGEKLNGANGFLPAKDYSQYPLLEGPPRINDVICYKLLELSENYTPEVSDYKVAKVLKYDSSLQELLLEFPQPIALYSKRGKFELTCAADDDEEEELAIYVKETTLNLTSLLEARLITDF